MSLNNKQLEKIALETYVLIRTDLAKKQQGFIINNKPNSYLIFLVKKIIKDLKKNKNSTELEIGYWKEILLVINRMEDSGKKTTQLINSLDIE